MLLSYRKYIAFYAPIDDRVRGLLGSETLQTSTFGHPVRLDNLRSRERGGADRTHLAAAYEVGESGERLLDINRRVGAMDLIKTQVISLETPQCLLDRCQDPAAGVSAPIRVISHGVVHLAGENDVVVAQKPLDPDFFTPWQNPKKLSTSISDP
ncbi:hypothetical protein NicSoilB8_45180 (plasmid) [Arthrobacter sp. NicSoilB8]|nr:hypothetical protein NicSoilB8_45180 [Arthrobacter sp. NicSoilB8]